MDEHEMPDGCECDNTHEQNDTVCRWCWAQGRRQWTDPEVPELSPSSRCGDRTAELIDARD